MKLANNQSPPERGRDFDSSLSLVPYQLDSYLDSGVEAAGAGIDSCVVVQVIPDPRWKVSRGADNTLVQDGCHHDGIAQHPLQVDVGSRVVRRETEEQGPHDAAAKGVRIVEGGVVVRQHTQPPGERLLCQAPYCWSPAGKQMVLWCYQGTAAAILAVPNSSGEFPAADNTGISSVQGRALSMKAMTVHASR